MAKQPLILASTSPRRSELLASAAIPFEVVSPPGDEATPDAGEAPVEFVVRAARAKALATAGEPRCKGHWVVAADTIVAIEREILGKPRDPAHAREMLEKLRGEIHHVFTAVAILSPEGKLARELCVGTEVEFARPSDNRLAAYIATGEPMDKAGAYAIQGQGAFLVKAIRGSYTNVVGLPLAETVRALEELGAIKSGEGPLK